MNPHRIALAYEMLTPLQACAAFSRGLSRPVTYRRAPISIAVPIPAGYRDQLMALETLFSPHNMKPSLQPPYFGDRALEDSCPEEALRLWEGPRGLEEYAREVFPLEEAANGRTWMGGNESGEEGEGWEDADCPGSGRQSRREEEWLA